MRAHYMEMMESAEAALGLHFSMAPYVSSIIDNRGVIYIYSGPTAVHNPGSWPTALTFSGLAGRTSNACTADSSICIMVLNLRCWCAAGNRCGKLERSNLHTTSQDACPFGTTLNHAVLSLAADAGRHYRNPQSAMEAALQQDPRSVSVCERWTCEHNMTRCTGPPRSLGA